MAVFATRAFGKQILDDLLSGAVKVALFTTPPTEVGTDGVEVSGGGYARQSLTSGPAADGSTGRTAQAASSAQLMFTNMPVASTAVHGLAICDATTGQVQLVNDTWSPTAPFSVGQNLLIDVGDFITYTDKS